MSKKLFKKLLVLIKYLKYLIKSLRIIRFQRNIINGTIGQVVARFEAPNQNISGRGHVTLKQTPPTKYLDLKYSIKSLKLIPNLSSNEIQSSNDWPSVFISSLTFIRVSSKKALLRSGMRYKVLWCSTS